jgi:hypothetical protein
VPLRIGCCVAYHHFEGKPCPTRRIGAAIAEVCALFCPNRGPSRGVRVSSTGAQSPSHCRAWRDGKMDCLAAGVGIPGVANSRLPGRPALDWGTNVEGPVGFDPTPPGSKVRELSCCATGTRRPDSYLFSVARISPHP